MSATTTTTVTPVKYNLGVKGDATSLVLSVYRVQRPPQGQATDQPDPVIISDVVRINYWLIGGGTTRCSASPARRSSRRPVPTSTWRSTNLGAQQVSDRR